MRLWPLVFAALLVPLPARADVAIVGDTACFDKASLDARLTAILEAHRPTGKRAPRLRVVARDTDTQRTTILLTAALADGKEVLRRHYDLAEPDCASAEDLLAAVVLRFVEQLPAASWPVMEPKTDQPKTDQPKTDQPKTDQPKTDQPKTDQPKTDQPKTDQPIFRGLDVVVAIAALGDLTPETDAGSAARAFELEVGAGAELLTSAHGFGFAGFLRASPPQPLGEGEYRALALLAQLGWKTRGRVRWGAGVRGGAIRVGGEGFDQNFHHWLAWIELGASVGYRWRAFELGASLWVAPTDHQVVTADRQNSVSPQRVRAGLNLSWSFEAINP